MPRTYLYKLTSDRGGAPCAPKPRGDAKPLLTLSICKPAIRRTAAIGDRLIGLTSRALERSDGYPAGAVIYAAVVTGAMEAREYYAGRSRFRSRPDCIYRFHQESGVVQHTGTTPLHADPAYAPRDIGRYPYYRNGRTLLSWDFRYFGSEALRLPEDFTELRRVADTLGQGHRVFHDGDAVQCDVDQLFEQMWRVPTSHTPWRVDQEASGHAPRH